MTIMFVCLEGYGRNQAEKRIKKLYDMNSDEAHIIMCASIKVVARN
ncbi:hypothetical protein VIOR3934_18580 [Vibrio orientalis CIP 102891 = ATCC 33934]|uniref:Uncharacterized protein n=1 Tax=Vibrio orientalis CIP 102891 = ATCC 33934 TaxID=675816 RepID=F9SSP9_VIBOR|nr:hypothetical protein VIOR3934_18580 [Vibrio orientalis CIP 102891 = ATCC 33934]